MRSFIRGVVSALFLVGCATGNAAQTIPSGAKYVAMGSSFAAGPGVTTSADTPPTRCGRSMDNYAHQLARRRHLNLVDVSCGGATTRHLLGAWSELPPQLDAVDADTKLVTVTIGGNDLGYMAGLMMASCGRADCPHVAAPTDQDYAALEDRMNQVAQQVRQRAPDARLVFVDYPAVLPPQGVCDATPLAEADAGAARAIAQRLAAITARVAHQNHADLVRLTQLSGHDACAADPWMNGFARPGHPIAGTGYHPNLEGMTAFADAIEHQLWP